MAKRAIPRKWLRHPPGWVGINWAHPRAVGLEFFAPLSAGHDMRDLVSEQRATRTGLEDCLPTKSGALHLVFGSGNYADFPAAPAGIGKTTPFTVAWTQEPRATSAYSTVMEFQFGTAGADQTFIVYLAAADSSYAFVAGPRGSSTHSWSSAVGFVTDNVLDRYILRSSGGPTSTTAANWSLYRNGALVSIGADTVTSGNTAASARIGAHDGASDPFEGLIGDVRMWSRVLSDDEAEVESTVDGALELYAPRRIWVPVSAGGGAGITGPLIGRGRLLNSPLIGGRLVQ